MGAGESKPGSRCAAIPQKVAVAVDESACSLEATRWAVQTFNKVSELHLVHVVKPTGFLDRLTYAPVFDTNKLMEAHQQAAAAAGAQQIVTHVIAAPTAGNEIIGDSLVDYAVSRDMDVFVMGSRGLSGMQDVLLRLVGTGSVTARALHRLPCTVAVHKPKLPPQPKRVMAEVAAASVYPSP